MSESPINQIQKTSTPSLVEFRINPLTLLVYFSTNTYHLASLAEFRKIGLTSIVEFGINTLALLVYFTIMVVANNMRSLGAQTTDEKR